MALISRNRGAVGLVLASAWLLASACGSSDKKGVLSPGEAGAAGASEAGSTAAGGAAGASVLPAAGEGGTAGVASPAAGAGGDSSVTAAGAAGEPSSSSAGAAGAAGAGALACSPVGATTNVIIDGEPIYKACRGALILASFTAGTSDSEFTCCATAATSHAYAGEVTGYYTAADGTGLFGFVVPDGAPLGSQALAVTCSDGLAENTISLDISDAAPPVLESITAQLEANQNLTIQGTGLLGVTTVQAVPDSGDTSVDCFIHAGTTDTTLVCDFDGSINPGKYSLVVQSDQCGYALAAPSFTIIPTP